MRKTKRQAGRTETLTQRQMNEYKETNVGGWGGYERLQVTSKKHWLKRRGGWLRLYKPSIMECLSEWLPVSTDQSDIKDRTGHILVFFWGLMNSRSSFKLNQWNWLAYASFRLRSSYGEKWSGTHFGQIWKLRYPNLHGKSQNITATTKIKF